MKTDNLKGYGILNIPESEKGNNLEKLINDKGAKIIIIKTGRVNFPELIYNNGTIYGENNIEKFLKNNL
ncbi:MAG: hypothetical protein QXZ17_10570 [Nitrososphaerota archaeon]